MECPECHKTDTRTEPDKKTLRYHDGEIEIVIEEVCNNCEILVNKNKQHYTAR